MRLLSTLLLLTITLLLTSCGRSATSECAELVKLTSAKAELVRNKIASDLDKYLGNQSTKPHSQKKLPVWKKKDLDKLMKRCLAATPERRAQIRKKLRAL